MIQALSGIQVLDNSGGRKAHCIKILKGKRWASLGDVVVVSLRQVVKVHRRQVRKVAVGKIYRMVVLQTQKSRGRFDGSMVTFSQNGGLLLHRNNNPVGTRIKGSLPNELRSSSLLKVVSLGPFLA
jgi:large subunit ribosomal protein L14